MDCSSQLGAFVRASHYSMLLFQPQGHADSLMRPIWLTKY